MVKSSVLMISAMLLAGCAYDGLKIVQIEPGMTKKQWKPPKASPTV
jgi:hypothetical protein